MAGRLKLDQTNRVQQSTDMERLEGSIGRLVPGFRDLFAPPLFVVSARGHDWPLFLLSVIFDGGLMQKLFSSDG